MHPRIYNFIQPKYFPQDKVCFEDAFGNRHKGKIQFVETQWRNKDFSCFHIYYIREHGLNQLQKVDEQFIIFNIMTVELFNEKYKDFLEEDHYGLEFGDEEFIKWLDTKFQEFIKIPGFKYSQIKSKFGTGRFYCEGISLQNVQEVEQEITKFCKK